MNCTRELFDKLCAEIVQLNSWLANKNSFNFKGFM